MSKIVTEQKSWFNWLKLALNIRSSVIRSIWRRVVAAMIFAGMINLIYSQGLAVNQPILSSLIPSIVLGLLLVFRTNTAYERYWEGRKLWGVMIHNGRILARNIYFFIPTKTDKDRETKLDYIKLVGTLVWAIKVHVRKEDLETELKNLLTPNQFIELQQIQQRPLRIANWLADYLIRMYEQNLINYRFLIELNQSMDRILEAMIACDRIASTPLPKAYSIHLKHLLLIYCLSVPFTFVEELNWLTVPAVGVITFSLLGIEEIGLEIENPFGNDPNDLPLEKFCYILQSDIAELIEYESQSSFDQIINESSGKV
ncbi:bestrophin, RFP-TM, chloride channel family protein [Lyngbya aestuarii BL J]|uniref:Bestrophin, RFP-TM, chloride channel family protein n=2 Tax=Lyngbya aestuarii BL J TaxID=1348334 RepID=U7Q7Z1_9CYAN|nr:bestrophin family ion channel [Lyngbya aestuarii]ERT03898.1 bestrophin, RFP-TM, chloride channel family protein [Lyngbya aestuarii BL J]